MQVVYSWPYVSILFSIHQLWTSHKVILPCILMNWGIYGLSWFKLGIYNLSEGWFIGFEATLFILLHT